MKHVTAIVDYGVGNLFSLVRSLAAVGADAVVTGDANVLHDASRIILPGVGAFADAARRLADTGLRETLLTEAKNGKPLLGVCLGMQLLFDKSCEYGEHTGLGLIPGEVAPLTGAVPLELKVPHIGWNKLDIAKPDDPLFGYLEGTAYAYYVHSYYAKTDPRYILATSDYGIPVTGAVRKDNVAGAQFHPEKSGGCGLAMLRAFCGM